MRQRGLALARAGFGLVGWLVAAVAMALWAWEVTPNADRWGTVSEWVTAVATVLALGAAFLAVRASWEVLGIEREREDAREAQERRREEAEEQAFQAAMVAAWTAIEQAVVAGSLSLSKPVARLQNASYLPVFDVTIRFLGPDGSERGSDTKRVLPPGITDIEVPRGMLRNSEDEDGEREKYTDLLLSLTFRDTAGRVWSRDHRGYLRLEERHLYGKRREVPTTAHGRAGQP